MEFLKSENLSLNSAGYLINTATNKPVTHVEFVNQQKAAHYLVSLAEAIKDKTFTVGKVDSLNAIKKEVLANINKATVVQYATAPIEPTSKVFDELIKYAEDFDKYHNGVEATDKINQIMNQFNTINDVETIGEYFFEDLVKLSKIYSISDILAAAKIHVEKIG